ncbi:hypothetical protein SAMN05421823_11437 [Catalinimonas alkaloidigena]|uniref:Uncharacterized protein n=1 Tax=Catalinimonas alkaloidigena TaxID=1075417 RepID=A0A1G9TJ63_9BACT|nr:hypothetical protein [Catalinimonas alkaloidigena]SDM47786.1 hypothetical protein SAMN05421823_11437 [Catalinimonas alkaloidigena]
MKYLPCLLCLLASCSEIAPAYVVEPPSVEEGRIRWIITHKFGVVELAGCEYIVSPVDGGYHLTHKGNCAHCHTRDTAAKAPL